MLHSVGDTMNAVAEPLSPPATPPCQRTKPLLVIRALVSLLQKRQRQIIEMIEDGRLAWAFEVGLDPSRARNKQLRVLPAAAAAYLRGSSCSLGWDEVLRLLVPGEEAVMTIQRRRSHP